ncbi:low temperature requirement protein A [Streptomyces sp. B6B3]|uniref:low temperature requirement protein A n=1 Tax=Streptomyces sp. B6B3 TaxID=3153570 RepID=UPI00325F1A13
MTTDRFPVWHRPMRARSTDEEHRAATPLELFFDLCFVVAVAQVSAELHHYLADGYAGNALGSYLAVFFAIWWAWMNYSWFASAYDVDDVPYRLATLVTIAGALVLAAGVPRAFADDDFALAVTGYIIMRVAMISLWLRAAATDAPHRSTNRRYAAGLAVVQVAWVGWLFLPPSWQTPAFPLFAALDLAVAPWAERRGASPWHPHHIAERYGLFTMIVLGESVLAATSAVRTAVDAHQASGELYAVAAGGLVTVFAMWWMYFAKPAHTFLTSTDTATFVWGYGHYLVFGSAAAVGAGLAVAVDDVTHHGHVSAPAAAATVTVPVALFVLTLWVLQVRPYHLSARHGLPYPVAALAVLATTPAGPATAVPATALVLAAQIALGVRFHVLRAGAEE